MLLIFRRWRSSAPWHQQFWFLDASADVRFLIDLALWCAVLGLPWDLPRSTKFKVLISTVCSLMVCIHLPKAKPSLKNGFQISTWSSLGAIQPLLRGGGWIWFIPMEANSVSFPHWLCGTDHADCRSNNQRNIARYCKTTSPAHGSYGSYAAGTSLAYLLSEICLGSSRQKSCLARLENFKLCILRSSH